MRPMTRAEVEVRAQAARSFVDVAQLVDDEEPESHLSVVGSLCVLAGIAASDAMCGHVLKERPRGQDHGQAVRVLETVRGAGASARALKRLLDEKDNAHYGTTYLSRDRVRQMLKHAMTMVAEMDALLAR